MGWYLDLILLIIVVLCIIFGVRRGFVRSAVEFVGYFAAIFLTFIISKYLAEFIFQSLLRDSMISTVEGSVNTGMLDNLGASIDSIWEAMPGFAQSGAAFYGVTKDSLLANLESASQGTVSFLAANVVDYAVKPIVVGLISFLLMFVLFIVFMFIVRKIAKIANAAASIPILGGVNRSLGGLLGVGKGLLISFLLCCLVGFIIGINGRGFLIFTPEAVDKSYLFKFLYQLNPLYRSGGM